MNNIIYNIIQNSNSPITQYEIAEKYAEQYGYIHPRQVRRIIRELREEGHPILSTPHKPAGYYMAISKSEGLEWYRQMRRKALKELVIARVVRDSCRRLEQVEQLTIF